MTTSLRTIRGLRMKSAGLALAVLASSSVGSGQAAEFEPFMQRCLSTLEGNKTLAKLQCICIENSIERLFPATDDREAAFIAFGPTITADGMKAYKEVFAQLSQPQKDAITAKIGPVSQLMPICLQAAIAGKVNADGTILE